MFWFALALLGQFTVRWVEPARPAFDVQWTTALPAAVTDATPAQGRATLIQRRKAEYKAAYDAAERDGKAVYRSDGLIGQPLPKGLYELILHKGEVWFIEVKPAGVPVPKPDPAAMFRGEDCLT